jgi:hypothetical protein
VNRNGEASIADFYMRVGASLLGMRPAVLENGVMFSIFLHNRDDTGCLNLAGIIIAHG